MIRPISLILVLALGALLIVLVVRGGREESASGPANSGTPSTRSPVELESASAAAGRSTDDEPPPVEGAGSDALAELRRFAESWEGRLDLAVATLDAELLTELRRRVLAGKFEAANLLGAAEREPEGSARRCLLLLACAWSVNLDQPARDRLAAFAVRLAEPLAAIDREALAATHALSFAGDERTLETVASNVLANAYAAPAGQASFPGLTSVRAWIALRDAGAFAAVELGRVDELLDPERARYRVTNELWALAARSAPEVWMPELLERVQAGDEHAREGLAALTDERYRPELFTLLDREWATAADAWTHGAAARGLVAIGDAPSLDRLASELAAPLPQRGKALEALGSWRSVGDPERLLELGERLTDDVDALAAWERGLLRGWDRVRFRRDGDARRAAFEGALEQLAAKPGAGSSVALAQRLVALEAAAR